MHMTHTDIPQQPGTDPRPVRLAYRRAIGLNLAFVAVEAVIALTGGSMGLLSDAGHKLIDVFTLGMALLGFRLGEDAGADRRRLRISALIALVNAVLLLCTVCVIVWGSILRLRQPAPVDGAVLSWTAGAGILVSGLSALLLMHHRGELNTRAAFWHMASDSLLSLGVVAAGIVISLTGRTWLDPAVSLLIAAVILYNIVLLVRDALRQLRST